MTTTRHLVMTEYGTVWLRVPDGDDERLGSIDNQDNCPQGLEKEWAYLVDEIEDQRRFADACLWTAQNSWAMAKGL